MEHHLGFGRFRLQRGRNRRSRRGCRWNLYGNYKPARGGKIQYFRFSRVAGWANRQVNGKVRWASGGKDRVSRKLCDR